MLNRYLSLLFYLYCDDKHLSMYVHLVGVGATATDVYLI
jgi:hypothetical protein